MGNTIILKIHKKIADGVYFIEAKGYTLGNSIVVVEDGDLFYMLHGDVTYTDEALYENKLSVVFEDNGAARETLDNVREFIENNKTVLRAKGIKIPDLSTELKQGMVIKAYDGGKAQEIQR